jgi:hypothetical protein
MLARRAVELVRRMMHRREFTARQQPESRHATAVAQWPQPVGGSAQPVAALRSPPRCPPRRRGRDSPYEQLPAGSQPVASSSRPACVTSGQGTCNHTFSLPLSGSLPLSSAPFDVRMAAQEAGTVDVAGAASSLEGGRVSSSMSLCQSQIDRIPFPTATRIASNASHAQFAVGGCNGACP